MLPPLGSSSETYHVVRGGSNSGSVVLCLVCEIVYRFGGVFSLSTVSSEWKGLPAFKEPFAACPGGLRLSPPFLVWPVMGGESDVGWDGNSTSSAVVILPGQCA